MFGLTKKVGKEVMSNNEDAQAVSDSKDTDDSKVAGDSKDTSNSETSQQPHAMQVNVKMQQGEHTGQPIYSNFTTVQSGPGVVIVDFGFLDPQTINALNRMAQSGEKKQNVNARMSCRMAISVEAASQLARQLNQLFQSKAKDDNAQTVQ